MAFGCVWNFFKGFAAVPNNRWRTGIQLLRDRAPLMGGSIGVWGTLYQIFYCSIKSYRKKTDIANVLYSGFLVSTVINIRSSGLRVAIESGIWSGIFLLIICAMLQVQIEANKKKETLRKNIEYTKQVNEQNRNNKEVI
jgi:hypothetical protein